MKNLIHLLAIVLLSLTFSGCGNYDTNKEGVSSGSLKLGVDNSYSLMMDSQVFTFTKLYEKAKIDVRYEPEADIIEQLLKDSIQAAIISRGLTKEELALFESRKRFPESVKIAVDGLALIIHPDNKDSVISMPQLKELFTGTLTRWEQIGAGNSGEVKVVFDNARSCNARTIKERFTGDAPFPANCFAVNTNEEVIDFVSKNKNAVGIISVSWISDEEDPLSQAFLKKVRVMGVVNPESAKDPQKAWKPYQAYIADGNYPLLRDVYAIRTGSRGSVGTGFVSFLAGEKGQLIIHKMGMFAANTPARIVRITDN